MDDYEKDERKVNYFVDFENLHYYYSWKANEISGDAFLLQANGYLSILP